TRSILERWGENPWPVLRTWLVGSLLISLGLIAAVTLAASLITPDYGFHYTPTIPHGLQLDRMGVVPGRNPRGLALHRGACIAGFIAGATLPLSAERRTGLSKVIHEKARPIAFGWVILVTCFSLLTQTLALGLVGSTIAWDANISVPLL